MAKALPFAAMLLLALAGCKGNDKPSVTGGDATKKTETKPAVSKLQIKDTKVGTGPAVATGDSLFMTYEGRLADGTVFDSTAKHGNKPFNFVLGGEVIDGWNEGIIGMRPGGTRELSIPWQKAYKEEGRPPTIPPKADLFFTVNLLDAVKQGDEAIVDRKVLKKGSGPAAKEGSTLTFTYVGTLVNGDKFDEKAATKPYTLKLGDPKVYEFFQVGLRGARKGDKIRLRVPPDAGPMGVPGVEGPQILIYTIDVLSVK